MTSTMRAADRRAEASPVTVLTADRRSAKHAPRWLRVGPFLTDVFVVLCTVSIVEICVLGTDPGHVDVLGTEIPYQLYSVALAVIWISALTMGAARSAATALDTSASYRRAVHASVFVFLGASVFAHFLKSEVSRTYTVLVFVVGLAGLVLGKSCWNAVDAALRASGSCRVPVVLADHVCSSTEHFPGGREGEGWHGLEIVQFVTVPPFDDSTTVDSVDSWVESTVETVRATRAGYLIVGARLAADRLAMQRLAWGMEGTGADLMLSPQFGLVGRGRVEMVQLGGQKWVHVRVAGRSRLHRFAKRVLDVLVSSLGLAFLSPLMLVIAVLVRRDSDGPAIFVQERIGKGGRPFSMLKFRSMRTGSAATSGVLRNDADGPLFKMRDDPRVTSIGQRLRRYSLDELPQLVNVLRGDMSIVGPRPALPEEVERYRSAEQRRLLLQPGLTGPWQVGGRSDLSWEQSIRMDLSYVENWSLTDDLAIIVRTFGAVLRARGAY